MDPETEVVRRQIRDACLDYIDRHERLEHDGEPCVIHRADLIAYLMHALGLGSLNLPLVESALAAHQARQGRSNGHHA